MANDKENLKIRKKPQEVSEEELGKAAGGFLGVKDSEFLSKCTCGQK